MFKDDRLKHHEFYMIDGTGKLIEERGKYIYGHCVVDGYYDECYCPIYAENVNNEIDGEDYYVAEVSTSVCDSDYHTYVEEINFMGVFLSFNIDTTRITDELVKLDFLDYIRVIVSNCVKYPCYNPARIRIDDKGNLCINIAGKKIDEEILKCVEDVFEGIKSYSKFVEEQCYHSIIKQYLNLNI